MIAYALVTFCAATLGTFLAVFLLSSQATKPRHPPKAAAPQHFPLDLDALDRPTAGIGED